jgi:hypothetical protein
MTGQDLDMYSALPEMVMLKQMREFGFDFARFDKASA